MEQPKQIQSGEETPLLTCDRRLEVRIAVLEERLEHTKEDLNDLDDRFTRSMEEIRDLITKIQNKPNAVQEFIVENWKSICMVVFVVLGTNATVIESLAKVLLK